MSERPEEPVPAAKPAVPKRTTGLSPAQQKLQAALEKVAQKNAGAKPISGASNATFRAKSSFAGKKTAFQRKAT
jgi:hypothetical protein